jgi:hypothetical protein
LILRLSALAADLTGAEILLAEIGIEIGESRSS